jgi:hypothetical protein
MLPLEAIAGCSRPQLHALRLGGGGAVATNSVGDSHPLRPPALANFSIPFAAYSANDSAPLWSMSSLSKFLCRAARYSSASTLPSLFLS